jgi:hypothetical protein
MLLVSPFFLKKEKHWLKISISFIFLFLGYYIVSVLGKYLFLSERYNSELFILFMVISSFFLHWILSFEFKFSRLLLALFLLVFCFLNMSFNPKNHYKNFKRQSEEHKQYFKVFNEVLNYPALIDHDHEYMLAYYIPRMIIKPLNIGYANLPNKKNVLNLEKDFFKNSVFVFYTRTCYWGESWGEDSRFPKCSLKQYLNHDEIREKYLVEKEDCFNRYCITLFHKKN